MKKCPFCAEEIQDEAVKCKHFGEFFNIYSDKKNVEYEHELNNSDVKNIKPIKSESEDVVAVPKNGITEISEWVPSILGGKGEMELKRSFEFEGNEDEIDKYLVDKQRKEWLF